MFFNLDFGSIKFALLFPAECSLILPDFSPAVVEKFLHKCYLSEDNDVDEVHFADFKDLAFLLGIKTLSGDSNVETSDVLELTISVNPGDIKGDTVESKLEHLKAINSGLTVSRGDVENVDETIDENDRLEMTLPIRKTRKLKKLGRLLNSSNGKLVLLKAPGKKPHLRINKKIFIQFASSSNFYGR